MIFSGFLALQVVAAKMSVNSEKKVEKHTPKTAQIYQRFFRDTKLTDLDGKRFDLSVLSARIVIINFWASWCQPCMQELPGLIELKKRNADNSKVAVFAINVDESDQKQRIARIQKKFSFNFPIIPDYSGSLANALDVDSVPVTIVYKDGKMLAVFDGPVDFTSEEFKETIR